MLSLNSAETEVAYAEADAERVLRLVDRVDFRPDVRWLAVTSGVRLDDVQRALHLLLHQRRLSMGPERWHRTLHVHER